MNNIDNSRLVSFNVRGLRDRTKRKHLFHIFRKRNYDVILLQETHCTTSDIAVWTAQWGGDLYCCCGTSRARGVITLIQKNLKYHINKEIKDQEGRVLILDISFNNQSIALANIYAPNEDTPSFFTEVVTGINSCDTVEYILSGDFNLALSPQLDRSNITTNNNNSMNLLREQMEHLDLVDAWRFLNPGVRNYTWRKEKLGNKASRLDYFLISNSLVRDLSECSILSDLGYSDHKMLLLQFQTNQDKRGPGYWKFNAMHLHDKMFVDNINDAITSATVVAENLNPIDKWEFIKTMVINRSKELSTEKAKKNRECLTELESCIQNLQNDIENLPFVMKEAYQELESLLCEHRVKVEQKVQSSIF